MKPLFAYRNPRAIVGIANHQAARHGRRSELDTARSMRALSWPAVALLLTGVLLANTSAAMSLRELRTLAKTDKQGDNYVHYYLVGVMEGALEAHAQDVRAGAAPTICLNGRRLDPSMAQGLYDTELQRNAGLYEADMPAQWVMTQALVTVYPC